MKPYRPVSCAIHSRYELLIMQGSPVRLEYLDSQSCTQLAEGVPVDLQTRHGEEFLVIQTEQDSTLTVRLDRIRRCEDDK